MDPSLKNDSFDLIMVIVFCTIIGLLLTGCTYCVLSCLLSCTEHPIALYCCTVAYGVGFNWPAVEKKGAERIKRMSQRGGNKA